MLQGWQVESCRRFAEDHRAGTEDQARLLLVLVTFGHRGWLSEFLDLRVVGGMEIQYVHSCSLAFARGSVVVYRRRRRVLFARFGRQGRRIRGIVRQVWEWAFGGMWGRS